MSCEPKLEIQGYHKLEALKCMAKQSGPYLVYYRDVLKSPRREDMHYKMSQGKPFFAIIVCNG